MLQYNVMGCFHCLFFIFIISSSSIVAVEEAMDTASRISCATNISADSSENLVYLGLRYQGKIGILFSASIFDYIYTMIISHSYLSKTSCKYSVI